jgi:hypothetical protein
MSHLLPGALEDDEHLPRLFVPQVVLPTQWARRSRAGLGERRLMVAVLLDAVAVYTKCRARGVVNRRFREVDRWFRSDDREWPFAFERICEVLSLNASLIRAAIDGQVDSRLMVRPEKPVVAEQAPLAPLADALADTL